MRLYIACGNLFVSVEQQHDLQRQKQNEADNVFTALTLWCGCVKIADVESNKLYIFPVGVPRLI